MDFYNLLCYSKSKIAGITMAISKWNPERVINATERRLRKVLKLMAIKVQTDAKILCLVDTGNLRKSIVKEVLSSKHARVGTNVEYALHVEYGTKFQKGKAYLRPALKKLTQRDINRMIRLIN